MSGAPALRRADKQLPEPACWAFLRRAYAGRVASTSAQGEPYITPLLHIVEDDALWVHTGAAHGHLRANLDANPRVCFEADEAGEVFPYGRFECDTGLAYTSVVVFGRMQVVVEAPAKQLFFERFMRKYADAAWARPRDFFPRLDAVTVYRIAVERLCGKETLLPAAEQLWPRLDRTKTPHAQPPG